MCEYIRRMVREIRAREIENHFKKELGIDFIKADFIGDPELLKPKYPHSINPHNFYPHPTILIDYSQIGFENKDKRVIENSLLFRKLLEVAENIGGCVTFFDVVTHQLILKEGDIIVCLDEQSLNKAKTIQKLNKLVNLRVLSIDEVWDFFRF